MSLYEHATNDEKIRRIREIVKQVHDVSTMDRSNFNRFCTHRDGCDQLPATEKDVTEFIRARTRLWRDSWITDPLLEALEILASIK